MVKFTSRNATGAGIAIAVIGYLTLFFLILLFQALALRFAVTWTIDVFSWYREVLNNLAGAVGA